MEDEVVQPLRYSGNAESQALNPFGERKKRVPPKRRVTRREMIKGRSSVRGNWSHGDTSR
jgi:hypothetical protein